jgi:hypothetical protein
MPVYSQKLSKIIIVYVPLERQDWIDFLMFWEVWPLPPNPLCTSTRIRIWICMASSVTTRFISFSSGLNPRSFPTETLFQSCGSKRGCVIALPPPPAPSLHLSTQPLPFPARPRVLINLAFGFWLSCTCISCGFK